MSLKITHNYTVDFTKPRVESCIEVMQGDACTRQIRFTLLVAGVAWTIPDGVQALARYRRSNGTEGSYDTLPDGSDAFELSGNEITVTISPEVLTPPGRGELAVTLYEGEQELTTWNVHLLIHPCFGSQASPSGDYVSIAGLLPGPEKAEVGQHLLIASVDASGKVTGVQAVDAIDGLVQTDDGMVYLASGGKSVGSGLRLATGGGLSSAAASLLLTVLKNAVYTSNQSATIAALESALASSGGDSGGETEKTLVSISAAYGGGTVPVGTAVTDLEGIFVVATYSDGSTDYVSGYILSGTIAEGVNVITVSYGGKTTTFTVTGVSEGGGDITPEIETFMVMNNLTHASTSNSNTTVNKGSIYLANILPNPGYELSSVTVMMGGADITSQVYSNCVVNIPSVTGYIVITAVAVALSGVYLYNNGDECKSITGGWAEKGFQKNHELAVASFTPQLLVEADQHNAPNTSTQIATTIATVNPIDLSGYARIVIDGTLEVSDVAGMLSVYLCEQVENSDTSVAAFGQTRKQVIQITNKEETVVNPTVDLSAIDWSNMDRSKIYLALMVNVYETRVVRTTVARIAINSIRLIEG